MEDILQQAEALVAEKIEELKRETEQREKAIKTDSLRQLSAQKEQEISDLETKLESLNRDLDLVRSKIAELEQVQEPEPTSEEQPATENSEETPAQ